MNISPQTVEFDESLPAWKKELSERLSAHRSRGVARHVRQSALPGMESNAAPEERAASVAARVAERYAKAPTYGEMLAAEAASKAARAAEAAAQAARQAQEAAEAVTEVLRSELEEPAVDSQSEPEPVQYRVDPASLPAARGAQNPQSGSVHRSTVDPHPHILDPFEEALVAPALPLPARVLEFPRELVATRKVRPRIAEGPLREPGAEPERTQLRIFEVEPETVSHEAPSPTPTLADDGPVLPEWSSIRLDAIPRNVEILSGAEPVGESMQSAHPNHSAPFSSRAGREAALSGSSRGRNLAQSSVLLDDVHLLHVAPITDRLVAATVDAVLILSAFLLFALVFMACTVHPPTGKPAIVAAGAALVGFTALYQWLFFTYAESTPGMRFAKIALCTFNDENPGRRTLQQRVGACFLAALPLGLGFLWAFLDEDHLGWHDRMTRTYQRSYK